MGKTKRAANGMGSIRQRPDGRWEGRYSDPNGRQRSVYGKTQKDVTAKLKAVLHEVDNGSWLEPTRMTVGEWMDVWMAEYQGHTTGRTMDTYERVVRLQIKPMLGRLKLTALLPIHIRKFYNDMIRAGYSPATVNLVHGVLCSSLRSAIDAGIINTNPAVRVKTPRVPKYKFTVIDREDIPAFIEAARNTKYENALVFLLMTGLRVGELRGLKWEDVDFDGGCIHVRRQLHSQSKAALQFAEPKDGGTRDIQLTSDAMQLLRSQRRQQAEERIAAGQKWKEDTITSDLVFRTSRGNYLSGTTLYEAVHAAGEALSLDLSPHDLRHSYAVAALRAGIDVKTVQNNLGHKSAVMTLDTYAAYTTDAGKEGAMKFEEYWNESLHN